MNRCNQEPNHQADTTYKLGDLLSSNEAATLFARREVGPNADLKEAKDRWRHRIKDHQVRGELRANNGQFLIEELVDWAKPLKVKGKPEWSSALADLPARPRTGHVCGSLPALGGATGNFFRSLTLEDSHKEIVRLSFENDRLHKEVEVLMAEVSRLRPDAERYRENCEKARAAAMKPRTRR